MPQNFIECQRDQAFLMPPDLRDWLPADHYYRLDGHGRAAYEPSMMGFFFALGQSGNTKTSSFPRFPTNRPLSRG